MQCANLRTTRLGAPTELLAAAFVGANSNMVIPRHLKKVPIKEALIDIRVKLPPEIDHTVFAPIKDKIAREYPKSAEHREEQVHIEIKSGQLVTPGSKGRTLGYIARSSDDKQVAQFRINGFTFSRLQPYETWERLRDEARRLWEFYLDEVLPERVTRVAVRYINHMSIPLPIEDFGDYMTGPPPVPQALPQGVSSFLTRVVIHEPSFDGVAIITQVLEAMVKPNWAPIILDIDAFKVGEFDAKGPDIWETLEQLRLFKNRIFFESITEKTVSLFE